MAGIQVPLLEFGGVAVCLRVAFALQVSMYVYVQAVEAPGMFPLAVDVSHVPDAFVYGRHFVAAVGLQLLGFGVHVRVSAACPEACTQIQARIQTEAFGLGFVHVVALAYLVESGVLVVQPHVVYLLVGEGAIVYHVADVVNESGDGHGNPAVVVFRIQ